MSGSGKSWISGSAEKFAGTVEASLAGAGSDALEAAVRAAVSAQELRRDRESLGLDAAANVMNPKAAAFLSSSLGTRPSLGHPGAKYEPGMEDGDRLEVIAEGLVRRLYGARFAELRVPSGAIANLYAFLATTKPGDTIIAFGPEAGGHVTHHAAGAAGLVGLKTHPVPFDGARMAIDIDRLAVDAEQLRPALITVAGSLCLYPYDVAAVREIADRVGARVLYDAAHMGGLIAGGMFQAPLAEGAHLMTMSTYKAYGGPPSGLVLTNDPALAEKLEAIAFPGLTANTDLARTAALAIATLDLIEHGAAYGQMCIANARALGAALLDEDIPVHFAEGREVTDSHHLAIRSANFGGANAAVARLAEARIYLCGIGLPIAAIAGDMNGLRLGTQEISRWGMTPADMPAIARLIAAALRGSRNVAAIAADVIALRQPFQTVGFVR